MSQIIPLAAIPNQSLSVVIDTVRYDIAVRQCSVVMEIDIARNSVPLVSGMRCNAGTLLLPFLSLENGYGNFAFSTEDDNYPDWQQFGITQFLIFITNDELVAARGF